MALVLPLLCAAAPAQARPHQRNFWDWVIDPNGAEIRVVIAKVEANLNENRSQRFDEDDSVNQARLEDARGMLRFGLRLEPKHPRLLLLMGQVCDDLGRTEE